MRAGGFPGNPGGLVVSIVKTAGGRAPAHQARGRGRSTWRPTERSRRCSDGTAGRRQRSAGGWTARSRSVSEYRRSGGIEPTRPRGGKGAPAGGTGGGKDGQHTEVGSRLHVTTTDSRTGQISLGDGGGHRLASWTSGYATARSEAICRGAGCGRTRTSGSVGGQGQQRPWSTRPQFDSDRRHAPDRAQEPRYLRPLASPTVSERAQWKLVLGIPRWIGIGAETVFTSDLAVSPVCNSINAVLASLLCSCLVSKGLCTVCGELFASLGHIPTLRLRISRNVNIRFLPSHLKTSLTEDSLARF